MFLSDEVWEKLSESVGAHEVIRLLLCGNKAFEAQLLRAIRRLNFRYAPQARFLFPRKLPNFARLLSLSVGRISPHMEPFHLEGFTYSDLPRTLEELDLEFVGTEADLEMGLASLKLDASEDATTTILPPLLRKLTVNTGFQRCRVQGTYFSLPPAPRAFLVGSPNLTSLDLSNCFYAMPDALIIALPETMIDLKLSFLYPNRGSIERWAEDPSTSGPIEPFFPPHLRTLHYKTDSSWLMRLLPTSLTDLAIKMTQPWLHREGVDQHRASQAFLKHLTSLVIFRYEVHHIESIISDLPPSIEHLHLLADGTDDLWSIICERMVNLKTLEFREGGVSVPFEGSVLDLPRTLTSVSSSVLEGDYSYKDLPPTLTDHGHDLICSGEEGLEGLPLTCAFKPLFLDEPTSRLLQTIPSSLYNSVQELTIRFGPTQEQEEMDSTLREISSQFNKIDEIWLFGSSTLPLSAIHSFKRPIHQLALQSDVGETPLRVDPGELDFTHSTLRYLGRLWLPSNSFNSWNLRRIG